MVSDASITSVNAGGQSAPRTSSWAVASFLCSIAVCCPPMTLVGPLLGARALVEMKAHPHVRGRGTALAGIVIGVVALLGWCVLAILWHIQARRPMVNGPEQ